jgi:hypothetical protein
MKTKFFMFVLSLAAVFGCDDSRIAPGKNTFMHFVDLGTKELKFSGNASDTILEAKENFSSWYIYSFDLPYHLETPLIVDDTRDILLKDNPSKSETLSYEWVEVSKTDNMLRMSIAENTSDTVRYVRLCLTGSIDRVLGQHLFITQYPKAKE